jgi:hypothetical protein
MKSSSEKISRQRCQQQQQQQQPHLEINSDISIMHGHVSSLGDQSVLSAQTTQSNLEISSLNQTQQASPINHTNQFQKDCVADEKKPSIHKLKKKSSSNLSKQQTLNEADLDKILTKSKKSTKSKSNINNSNNNDNDNDINDQQQQQNPLTSITTTDTNYNNNNLVLPDSVRTTSKSQQRVNRSTSMNCVDMIGQQQQHQNQSSIAQNANSTKKHGKKMK